MVSHGGDGQATTTRCLRPQLRPKEALILRLGFQASQKTRPQRLKGARWSPTAAPARGGTPAVHGCRKTGASLVQGSSNFTTECARTWRNSMVTPRYARCPRSVRTAASRLRSDERPWQRGGHGPVHLGIPRPNGSCLERSPATRVRWWSLEKLYRPEMTRTT